LTLAQASNPAAARGSTRTAWFGGASRDCPVLWREGLAPGAAIPGPAVLEALDSTTVVPPGWVARVAEHGFLRLTRS
jgi:N-methylhydantoinase A